MTAEQQARDMIERITGMEEAQQLSAGDVVELANLIADRGCVWRPIETAPRDGTEVLVCRAYADELNARCIADAADAARYRWLRHGDNDDICIEFAEGVDCYADDVWLLRGEKLDAVIDAGIEHDAKAAEHVAVGPGLGAA